MEFSYVNGEVWLPKRESYTVSGRVLLMKGIHEQKDTVFSNYQKFSTDSRIVGSDQ